MISGIFLKFVEQTIIQCTDATYKVFVNTLVNKYVQFNNPKMIQTYFTVVLALILGWERVHIFCSTSSEWSDYYINATSILLLAE